MKRFALTAAAILVFAAPAAAQLDPPPGPIEPTGISLSDIETSTPLGQDTTPGDATAHFVISQPGTYHLTEGVFVDGGKSAILITAPSDVTIDLRGFFVSGGNGGLHGVTSSVDSIIVTVRNGALRGFSGSGINLGGSSLVRVENIDATGNGVYGVHVGPSSFILDTRADQNDAGGIVAGDRAVIRRVTAINGLGEAIDVGDDSTIEDIQATGAFTLDSCINGGDRTIVRRARVLRGYIGIRIDSAGQVHDSIVVDSSVIGIDAGQRGVVSGCEVEIASIAGIVIAANGIVRDSRILGAGIPSSSRGILVADGSLISGCTIENPATGIESTGSVRIESTAITGSVRDAINVGAGASLWNVTVTGATDDGIVAGNGASIIGCTVTNVTGDGIRAGSGSVIKDCMIQSAGLTGILAANNANIQGCVVNTAFVGIQTATTALVRDNVVNNILRDGIVIDEQSMAINNKADFCGTEGGQTVGAGILALRAGNHIEGNAITRSDSGVTLSAADNLVIRNSFTFVTNTVLGNAATNSIGTILTQATFNSDKNPYANFAP